MVRSRYVRALPLLGLALALGASAPDAAAQEPNRRWTLDMALGSESLWGHTTYRIEASDGVDSIASELEFPLTGLIARVQAEAVKQRSSGARVVLRFVTLASLTGSGTMKDSDWLSDGVDIVEVGAPHPGLDIYSESDAKLTALGIEISAAYELRASRNLIFAPLVGLLYQRFSYDVSNVRQEGYGPYAATHTGNVPGKALDYRVSYLAPYLGARAALAFGRFTLTGDAWYSPVASADDRDDHLLRDKLSKTSADGTAWQAGVGGRLELRPRRSLQLQVSTIRIRATGLQHQTFYDGSGLEFYIDSTITSARNSVVLAYVHGF